MGNFRRKKILQTLMDKTLSYEEKTETLEPYEDLIERVIDQYQLPTEEDKPIDVNEEILENDSTSEMNSTIDNIRKGGLGLEKRC